MSAKNKVHNSKMMSYVYISESGVVVGIEKNRLAIKYKDGMTRTLPIETVDGIVIIGRDQLTTQCMIACMERGIPVSFISKAGRYFGRLMSTGHIKAPLQRKQSELYDTDFSVKLARIIVQEKINNQTVVLRRYARNKNIDIKKYELSMKNSMRKINESDSIDKIIGFEGNAARTYFEGLSNCIDDRFKFKGRSRRPPRDEFNSLISLGYSILMNEIYAEIENHGLNPYFGFIHRDSEKHPTLASDLMEEWRAVIVDSLAMSLINGHEIGKDDFYYDMEESGCFIAKDCLKNYLRKLEEKFTTKTKYLNYIDYSVDFRHAISLQIRQFAVAIEEKDANVYQPIRIR